jgi:photosystem II stability/assembly factor-like uncharacterized protein
MQSGNQMMNSMNSAAGQWENLGPNHLNDAGFNVKGIGRVNCTFRNNVNEYAGSAGGGLWYRAIGSTNWFCPHKQSAATYHIGYYNRCRRQYHLLYSQEMVMDQEGWVSSSGIGVLKSTDGGNYWQTTTFKFSQNALLYGLKLISDTSDLNIQYAATNLGLYRTFDGWNSFSLILSPAGNTQVPDIEINPASNTTIYACNSAKVYKSTNRGNTWPDSAIISPANNIDRICIAVTPANSNYLYVLWGNGRISAIAKNRGW